MKKNDTTKRMEEALSSLHPEEKDALRTIWSLSADADEVPNIKSEDIDALWGRLALHAESKPGSSMSESSRKDRKPIARSNRRVGTSVWASTAVALLLVAVGIFLYLRPIAKTAPYGEQIAVNLSDGSVIELNSGSTITYPRFFRGNRTVSLEGEAYFDVTESDVPFIVHTFNADVKVLGTTFNIHAWKTGWRQESVVTLTSGSVHLSPRLEPEQSIVMSPGQTIAVREEFDGFVESTFDNMDHVLAWRKGELVFKDQQLIAVLEEIERRFGIKVELQVNQLLEKEVTFAYRRVTSAENILEDLCHALDLQYRPISNGYELFEE